MARRTSSSPRLTPVRLPPLEDGDRAELVEESSHDARRYGDLDVSGLDLTDMRFGECAFDGVRSDALRLRGSRITDSTIERLEAPVLDAPSSFWRDVEIVSSRSGSTDLYDAELRSVSIGQSKFGYLNLRGAKVSDVVVRDTVLEELDLGGAEVTRLALPGCRIGVLDVSRARLVDVDLRGAEFSTITGVESLKGAIVSEDQLAEFAPLFAAALGVRVE
ncbi:pentapeptide repeat-containing protein [Labedella endophytica]|uniref:Pentapeptide repeat-containing protein n=1 Tax=Labedella endophytica TaxID=1523160 RepID=A0A3S0X5C9_9MICO|nr:pentapeptide repeat-containing protein [Labedella endophytica]RUQ98973.1 pentapeptide repeat-containing protein [Labedella endophytica]